MEGDKLSSHMETKQSKDQDRDRLRGLEGRGTQQQALCWKVSGQVNPGQLRQPDRDSDFRLKPSPQPQSWRITIETKMWFPISYSI